MNKILSFFITLFIFIYPLTSIASSTKSIGEKGDPNNIDRVINIKMYDNYYEPNSITVKKGETIKFIITNLGKMVHEYNIGTKEQIKILDLAKVIIKTFNKKLKIKKGKIAKGGTEKRTPNISKIQKLGFKQKFNIKKGINIIINKNETI